MKFRRFGRLNLSSTIPLLLGGRCRDALRLQSRTMRTTRTKTSRLGHVVQGLQRRAEADERGEREVFLVIHTPNYALTNRRRSIPTRHDRSKATQRGRGSPCPRRAERPTHSHPRQLYVRPRRREGCRPGKDRRAGLRSAYLCTRHGLRPVPGGTGRGRRGRTGQ